jgi:hypothetical protein
MRSLQAPLKRFQAGKAGRAKPENARYLNIAVGGPRRRAANIRSADGIVSEKGRDNGDVAGMRSLGERGMNGSRASRPATTIEDMFSVSNKILTRFADAERIPDHKGRQGRQERVEIPGLRGWQSGGNFN